jgi:ribosomal protein L11 methyltransferase
MIRISATIDEDLVEPLEDHLCEAISPWCIVHPRPEDPVSLQGFFPTEREARTSWEDLRQTFPTLADNPATEPIRDEDWMESYKNHLHPWSHGRLHWIPAWEKDTAAIPADAAFVALDSGLAFGTGSHETTRLCARSLVDFAEKRGVEGQVIDAGCGSGVLALSAVKLGFGGVHAFDNDPEAIRVTRENARANGVEGALSLAEAGIEEGLRGRTCDLLLANIQSNVLCLYADEFLAALRPGGRLALSGILAREAPLVAESFAAAALSGGHATAPPTIATDGEWSLVVLDQIPSRRTSPDDA